MAAVVVIGDGRSLRIEMRRRNQSTNQSTNYYKCIMMSLSITKSTLTFKTTLVLSLVTVLLKCVMIIT